MNTSGLRVQTTPDIRGQFFQWALKWFYEKSTEKILSKPDLPTLVCLLQAVGFKLQQFEKCETLKLAEEPPAGGSIRISVECGTSKMMATLQMDEVVCECPSSNEEVDGSFWSITGSGPLGTTDNANKIEETGSNLLPQMSKETTIVVRDVVQKLCKIINNKNEEKPDSGFSVNALAWNEKGATPKNKIGRSPLLRSRTEFFEKPEDVAKFATNLLTTKSSSSMSLNDSPADRTASRLSLSRRETFDIVSRNKNNGAIGLPKSPPKAGTNSPKTRRSNLSRHGTYDKLDSETSRVNDILAEQSAPKIILGKQETFDNGKDDSIHEPRQSIAPKTAISSPSSEMLTASFGQLSLQSEEELLTLGEYVIKAHQILESAIRAMSSKLPRSIHSSQSSIPEEAQFLKPLTPPPGELPIGNSSFLRSPSTRSQLQQPAPKLTRVPSNLSTMSSSSGMSSASRSFTTSRSASGASTGNRNSGIPSAAASRITKRTPNSNNSSSVKQPQLRDRSLSFNSAQRPQLQRQQYLGVPGPTLGCSSLQKPAVPQRRNSTNNLAASALAKRNATPTSGALAAQNGPGSQRKSPLAPRLLQPSAATARTTGLTRANSGVSRLKVPGVTSKLNKNAILLEPSKFGFAGARK